MMRLSPTAMKRVNDTKYPSRWYGEQDGVWGSVEKHKEHFAIISYKLHAKDSLRRIYASAKKNQLLPSMQMGDEVTFDIYVNHHREELNARNVVPGLVHREPNKLTPAEMNIHCVICDKIISNPVQHLMLGCSHICRHSQSCFDKWYEQMSVMPNLRDDYLRDRQDDGAVQEKILCFRRVTGIRKNKR